MLDNLQVHVSHVFQEGNCVADKLSSIAISLQGITWFNPYSTYCNEFIFRDAMGLENDSVDTSQFEARDESLMMRKCEF